MRNKLIGLLRHVAAAPLLLVPLCLLVYDPSVFFPFITLKATVFHALVMASLALSAVLIFIDATTQADLKKILSDNLVKANLLLISVIALSCFQASNPMYALLGSIERSDGLYLYLSLTNFLLLSNLVLRVSHWRLILLLLVLVGLVLIAFQLLQYSRGVYRPGSLIGQPTFLSAYYALCIGCTLVLINGAQGSLRKINNLVAGALVFMFLTAVVMSGTRSTALGLVLSTIFIMYLQRKENPSGWRYFLVVGLILLACTLLLFFGGDTPRLIDFSKDNATIWSRIVNYQISWAALNPMSGNWQRLLFGWGWNNFYLAWDRNYLAQIENFDPLPFDRAHNFYLDLLVMTGMLGLTVFGLLVRKIYQSTLSISDKYIKAGLILIFTTHFTEYLFNFDSLANLISMQIIYSYLISLRMCCVTKN